LYKAQLAFKEIIKT